MVFLSSKEWEKRKKYWQEVSIIQGSAKNRIRFWRSSHAMSIGGKYIKTPLGIYIPYTDLLPDQLKRALSMGGKIVTIEKPLVKPPTRSFRPPKLMVEPPLPPKGAVSPKPPIKPPIKMAERVIEQKWTTKQKFIRKILTPEGKIIYQVWDKGWLEISPQNYEVYSGGNIPSNEAKVLEQRFIGRTQKSLRKVLIPNRGIIYQVQEGERWKDIPLEVYNNGGIPIEPSKVITPEKIIEQAMTSKPQVVIPKKEVVFSPPLVGKQVTSPKPSNALQTNLKKALPFIIIGIAGLVLLSKKK